MFLTLLMKHCQELSMYLVYIYNIFVFYLFLIFLLSLTFIYFLKGLTYFLNICVEGSWGYTCQERRPRHATEPNVVKKVVWRIFTS